MPPCHSKRTDYGHVNVESVGRFFAEKRSNLCCSAVFFIVSLMIPEAWHIKNKLLPGRTSTCICMCAKLQTQAKSRRSGGPMMRSDLIEARCFTLSGLIVCNFDIQLVPVDRSNQTVLCKYITCCRLFCNNGFVAYYRVHLSAMAFMLWIVGPRCYL